MSHSYVSSHYTSTDFQVTHDGSDSVVKSVEKLLNDDTRLPPAFSISNLDRDHYPDFVQSVAQRCGGPLAHPSGGLSLIVDPEDTTLPTDLQELLRPICSAYQRWRNDTSQIRKNFTDERLTIRAKVLFDEDNKPAIATLSIGFHFLGIPADSIPTVEDMLRDAPAPEDDRLSPENKINGMATLSG